MPNRQIITVELLMVDMNSLSVDAETTSIWMARL